MTGILKKFFDFCPEEYRKKFYESMVLGILAAACRAAKIPAAAIVLSGVLKGDVKALQILEGFALLAVGVVLEGLLRGRATDLQTQAGYGTAAEKRVEIAEHLRYVPMGYFNEKSLGEITSVAANTCENLQGIATRVVLVVSEGILSTALIIAVLFFFDWREALLLLAGCAVYALMNLQLQRQAEKMAPKKAETDTVLVEEVLEYIQGMQEVKSCGLTGEKSEKLNRAIDRNAAANTDMEMALVPWMTVQSMVTKAAGTLMALSSVWFYLQGSMDLLTVMIMIISSFMVYASLEGAGSYSGLLRTVDICVDRVNAILSIPQMHTEGEDLVPESYGLETEEVSFSYNRAPVLTKISSNFPEHQVTAIVGPSGSGKTTLVSLLARFWDPERGRVLLGGREEMAYSMESLMKNFSFVFQRVYLFCDTIAENIRFGCPDASMEEVISAARKARCHDFIMALPQGYETVIEENGGNLSGGERQRISIARAMLKQAPIIILDEATANVDPENENELLAAIDSLTKDRTVIMIAHRMKTVKDADQILVLEKGRIVQRGTHEELMKEEGTYRRFVSERTYAEGWKL